MRKTMKEEERTITLNRSPEPEYEEYYGPWWTCPTCGSKFIMGHFLFCPECGRTIEWVGDTDD